MRGKALTTSTMTLQFKMRDLKNENTLKKLLKSKVNKLKSLALAWKLLKHTIKSKRKYAYSYTVKLEGKK